jgi:chorismate--pyruvate lyase
MQRLRQHGIANAQVKVVNQRWEFPARDEKKILAIPERQYALVREVLISSPEGVWMFARSVIPRTTLTGKEKQLAHLKTRPLGTVLFSDPMLVREEFEIASILPNSSRHKKISHYTPLNAMELWGRRSVFFIRNKSLLLSEFYFPQVAEL